MKAASRIRRGDYRDSIQLMQLRAGLESLPGIGSAVAMMATAENLDLLRSAGWPLESEKLAPNDMVVGVRAENSEQAEAAFSAVEGLLRQRTGGGETAYRPRSLDAAAKQVPEARWALVSTAGTHAVGLARRALQLNLNVFLFSDHVSLADEVSLKEEAGRRGLLMMGPDCGTAIVNGVGFGFANGVRRGGVGLVGSSGTGLQAVCCQIHELGAGVSHALGVGGRDLSDPVGAVSTLQALDLLRRDPATRVVALVSKPPGPQTAAKLTALLRQFPKPVAACFLGMATPVRRLGSLRFAVNLSELASLAVDLSKLESTPGDPEPQEVERSGRRWLRALFCGGTLASEALQRLECTLSPIHSNLASRTALPLDDPERSQAHTVLDLGEDAFTLGRPHPMIDPDPLVRRLEREAADPETAAVVFDVVLGHGAHPDPAARLAPVVARTRQKGVQALALLVGTDQDPQDVASQRRRLEEAGAVVFSDSQELLRQIEDRLAEVGPPPAPPVSLQDLDAPVAALNVGLEAFHDSLQAQGATVAHVDWRPPAGGDPALAALLERMKRK